MEYIEIGEKIAMVRKSKGITYRKLASMTGLSSSFLCDLEKGKKWPRLETLSSICEVLKTKITIEF